MVGWNHERLTVKLHTVFNCSWGKRGEHPLTPALFKGKLYIHFGKNVFSWIMTACYTFCTWNSCCNFCSTQSAALEVTTSYLTSMNMEKFRSSRYLSIFLLVRFLKKWVPTFLSRSYSFRKNMNNPLISFPGVLSAWEVICPGYYSLA